MMPEYTSDTYKLYSRADQLPARLWGDLESQEPVQRALICQVEYGSGVFRIDMFAGTYLVDTRARNITLADQPDLPVSFSAGLPLLAYLSESKGVPPSGNMISPLELAGGEFFFKGPHALPTKAIEERFGNDMSDLDLVCRSLGGEPGGDAPLHFTFSALPLLPMALYYWPGDSEFGAKAAFSVDSRAGFHMALDALWSLLNHFAALLTGVDPLALLSD